MDLEGSCFGAFLGEEEKRRAEKKVQEEKKKLKAEYDKSCKDEGIPPHPIKTIDSYILRGVLPELSDCTTSLRELYGTTLRRGGTDNGLGRLGFRTVHGG
jgi:hypothetical protein